MSSSMPIPKRKQPVHMISSDRDDTLADSASHRRSSSSAYSAASSYSSTSTPPSPFSSMIKAKQKVDMSNINHHSTTPPSWSPSSPSSISQRRPSLLGSSLSHSEYIVVNLGHADGPPRLVTCVKSSQGFDWNQELFLPSYAHYDSHDLEHRPDPVKEIILSDEEAASLLPQ